MGGPFTYVRISAAGLDASISIQILYRCERMADMTGRSSPTQSKISGTTVVCCIATCLAGSHYAAGSSIGGTRCTSAVHRPSNLRLLQNGTRRHKRSCWTRHTLSR